MIKNLRLMLIAALTMICGSTFAQEETTVTWEAASGDALTTIYPDGNIKLVWEEGGGDFAPKYVTGSVYFYNGNRVTVAGASSDVTITKVVFTFSSGSASIVTCNASGKNESSYGITTNTEEMTATWEGEATNLIFRAPKQTGVRYITSIAVTYTGGTTGPVETAPVLNITQDNLAETYSMDDNSTFAVYAKNEGNAAAENAKLTLYVDGEENASATIGTLAIGQEVWKNFKYDVTKFEAGERQVKLALTADNADAFEVEKTVTFTKAAPEATLELTAEAVEVQLPVESIEIPVTVKNTSEIAAENVTVNLWNNGVIASATIESLAAGATETVTFTIDALAAGTYSMQALTANNKYGCNITVTVLAAPVTPVYDLAITDITGTLDLANETNNVRVIVENKGNQDITDATVTLKAGETVLGTATISVNAGQSNFCYIAVASEGLEAGDLAVTATVEVENDANADDNTRTATLTVKEIPAPEATFNVVAENVTVAYGAESFDIVATVTNTSEVDAQGLTVKLLKGITEVETKTLNLTLPAGESTTVTFTIEATDGGFTAGSTENYYVQAGAGQANVTVTFEEAPVTPVYDLAITDITGTLDLANETNNVRVIVENKGNQDITDATVTLKAGETVLGTATISVNAGQSNFCYIAVASEGLEAGDLAVTATVEVENDANADDNTMTATLTVKEIPAPEATFNVVAENVTVAYGAESFDIVATVTNTSEVDAQGLTVKLLKGATVVEEKTLDLILLAGESTEVTFTVAATEEEPFAFGSTAKYYVQSGAGQAEVTVTFEAAPVEAVIDMAITAIQGVSEINLSQENKVQVWYQNNGNVDLENIAIVLSINEHSMEVSVNVAAGKNGYVDFILPTNIFDPNVDAEAELVASVNVENDTDNTNDTVTKTLAIVKGEDTTSIQSIKAQLGNVQIFDLNGKKVNNVKKGAAYIINGKKVVLK
jgi:hypothetical protein